MKPIALLPYLLVAAGLLSTLALFVTLKFEISRNSRRQKRRIEEMLVRLDAAEEVPRTVSEEEPAVAAIPMPSRPGLNLSTRVHALRMLRRGEGVAHVAAALGVPRKEVELLIRVQTFGRARAVNAGSE